MVTACGKKQKKKTILYTHQLVKEMSGHLICLILQFESGVTVVDPLTA